MTTKTTNGNYKFKGWKDLTGTVFNRLTVLRQTPSCKNGGWWDCECRCKQLRTYPGHLLKSGHRVSCGCLSKETGPRKIYSPRCLADLP